MLNAYEQRADSSSLGRLYFEKGELKSAVPHLEQAKDQYLAQKKIRKYFETSYMLLRSYLEMGQTERVESIKKSLQTFVLEESIEMSSKLYYTLGVCALFDSKYETSLRFFNQAFNAALSESNKEDMCFALVGKAAVYKRMVDFEKAVSVLENLKLFFESINLPEVEASVWILEAQILTQANRCDEAVNALWKAYATAKKLKSIQLLNMYVLIQFGETYAKMNKYDMAEEYYNLAESQIRKDEHVRLFEVLTRNRQELESQTKITPDIKIDLVSHKVTEISKGELEFNNQFILLELLVELVKRRGSCLSKDDLAEMIWRQDYDPSLHDNKIYVTIRRLRKILEPNPKKPHYVLRTKEGYQLNPAANVLVTS